MIRSPLITIITQRVASKLGIPNRTFSGWEKRNMMVDQSQRQSPVSTMFHQKVFSRTMEFGKNEWADF